MNQQQQNPWLATRTRSGAEYDAPYERQARAGVDVHGEANLVQRLLADYFGELPCRVLDAGCGTGRMGIELARRGFEVVGVDLDAVMLAQAKAKAPTMQWVLDDLSRVSLNGRFEAIVMAGNVMIYVTPGTEEAVVANMVRHLQPGGLLLAAFELTPPRWSQLTLAGYEQIAAAAGLAPVARWSTWDQEAWQPNDSYVVSLHRKLGEKGVE